MFMGLHIEWRKQPNTLGDHRMMLFALPGVGNVGKAALEGLTQVNECTELVRLHHTALPPLAMLYRVIDWSSYPHTHRHFATFGA